MSIRLLSLVYILSYYFMFNIHSIASVTTNTSFGFTNETDRLALLAIKDLIQEDPFHALTTWNDSLHFCNWHGVTCGFRHQRVISLNMPSLKLVGSLSPRVGNLTFLKQINLEDNNFHGTIPQEVGGLFRLQYLRLANNSFQGKIPINLTRCLDLGIIDLSGNNLDGNIPVDLDSFSKLYELSLSRNNLTGNIPPSIGNLSSLRILGLSRNNLHGSIPIELGNLSNLQSFELSSNKLSGTIPTQIYNISSIQIFSVTNNLLTGPLPPNLGLTLPKLNLFLADLNQFFGSIPASLANASGLVKISLGDNNLTGPIPLNLGSLQELQVLNLASNPLGTDKANDISFLLSSLTNCSNLRTLSLSRIQIGGVLPDSIANLSTKLTSVWLDQNYISGSIPVGIVNLVNLSYLTLDTNMITGNIPDSLGKLTKLEELYLFKNNISGKIPSSIGTLTRLSVLILKENMLEGSIPVSLGNCSGLQELDLSHNYLTGAIPMQILDVPSLSLGLNLAWNNLSGPLQLGNLFNLGRLDISNNRLSGEIPVSLGRCQVLELLNMQGNLFEGTIPSSLSGLRGIRVLDLSRNNLSGLLPGFLVMFQSISYLNLSFNVLEGEVPNKGVFMNSSKFSILGNKKLCGGIMSLKLPSCPKEISMKQRNPTILAVILVIGIGFILLTLLLAYHYWRRISKAKASSESPLGKKYPKLTYAKLVQATDGFSPTMLIGKGRYGSVYKGTLDSSEKTIAVKVLNLQQRGAKKSFVAECEALRNIRHRNIVKIITSCSTTDFKRNEFKALVYEFMSNGSLESWLHPSSAMLVDSKKYLTLIQRLNIAIDVASALHYLHRCCEIPIIHCDIKPSNILLDNELCAHVADFGLARFLLASDVRSKRMRSNGIAGTVGYIALEYGIGGPVSTLIDVYSYGILLLEIFTGKRPTDEMFRDNYNLHNYVKMSLPSGVMGIVDPLLILEWEEESNRGGIEECLALILKIGVVCSSQLPSERMDVADVLMEMCAIKNVFLRGPS